MGDGNQAIKQSSNQPYSYQRLDVWLKAQAMAAAIIHATRTIRRDSASVTIVRQLAAAAGSIGANIAEGHGRYTLATYRNHLSIARGSAAETGSWLDLLLRTGYLSNEDSERIQGELSSIVAILTTKMRDLDNRIATRNQVKIKEPTATYRVTESADEEISLDDLD